MIVAACQLHLSLPGSPKSFEMQRSPKDKFAALQITDDGRFSFSDCAVLASLMLVYPNNFWNVRVMPASITAHEHSFCTQSRVQFKALRGLVVSCCS